MTSTETATQTLTISQLATFLEDKLTVEDMKDMLFKLLTLTGWREFEAEDNMGFWKIMREGDLFIVAVWPEDDC